MNIDWATSDLGQAHKKICELEGEVNSWRIAFKDVCQERDELVAKLQEDADRMYGVVEYWRTRYLTDPVSEIERVRNKEKTE